MELVLYNIRKIILTFLDVTHVDDTRPSVKNLKVPLKWSLFLLRVDV